MAGTTKTHSHRISHLEVRCDALSERCNALDGVRYNNDKRDAAIVRLAVALGLAEPVEMSGESVKFRYSGVQASFERSSFPRHVLRQAARRLSKPRRSHSDWY